MFYDTEILELSRKIVPGESSHEWRGDGKLLLTLAKEGGPRYWPNLFKDKKREDKEYHNWKEMKAKYSKQLLEYIEDEVKESAADNKNEEL